MFDNKKFCASISFLIFLHLKILEEKKIMAPLKKGKTEMKKMN